MQGIQKIKSDFNITAANDNRRLEIKQSHVRAVLNAYGFGRNDNQWFDRIINSERDIFCLMAFGENFIFDRSITVFRCPAQDNDGYLFRVETAKQNDTIQTNDLKTALSQFQLPRKQFKALLP